jgi:type I restriction enzyme S subunit
VNRGLPRNWACATLDDVASWGSGGTPSRTNPQFYGGGIPWLKTGELGCRVVSKTEETISELGLANSSAKLFPKGAVVVAMYGATIGKTSILGIDATTNQACAVAVPYPAVMTSEYLFHYLSSQREAFVDAGKGGAQPNISQRVIRDWPIPLAPLPEQKRIVDKLDALLGRVDACRERLDRVPGILKRFRQSVLAAATSGELTREWRAERGRSRDEWATVRIREIVTIKNGRAFPSSDYGDQGVRLLRPGNLHMSGRVRWDEDNTRRLPTRYADEFPDFVLGQGELLMNLTAQSLKDEFLGRVCLKGDGEPALLNQRICAFYPTINWDVRPYLLLYFKSPIFRGYVDTLDSGTLIKHMHSKQLLEHELALPSEDEAEEISRRADSLLSTAEQVERRLLQLERQSLQMPGALLTKAFRGELVRQDSKDRPASELLASIRAASTSPESAERAPKRPRRKAS